mgnify:CR=1 FL=1
MKYVTVHMLLALVTLTVGVAILAVQESFMLLIHVQVTTVEHFVAR